MVPTGIELAYKIPNMVKLLFETTSGFALFSFDEIYLDKDIEDIWVYLVDEYWHQNIIWLHEFQKLEDKDFRTFSKVDIEDWSLLKLATALKLTFDPRGGLKAGDAYEMFTRAEFTMMSRDVPRYQDTISKDIVLSIYNDAVTLREDKMELLHELDCLVEEGEAKAAKETEEERR